VVEFCDGGDVFERVIQQKKFSEQDAAFVIAQVASGLAHVHQRQVVHRDLKPDNLMYLNRATNSQIKIIDFGLAGDVSQGPCTTPCGTAHYAAPEVLSNVPYGVEADIWSLGIIIYTLLCGFPPFFDANNNLKNLYHMIKKGKYSFPSPFWDEISQDAKTVIRKLLLTDPKQRLTADQILEEPWIAKRTDLSKKNMSERHFKQIEYYQSIRNKTEMALGQEANAKQEKIELFAKFDE